MTTAVILGINWCSSVVKHFCISFLCCQCDGVVGIVHHQLLAKGVDETAGAARNGDFHGIQLLDGHRVAQAVAPQAVGGRDDKLIGAPCLDFPDGIDFGCLAVAFLDGQEFKENTCVKQQEHRLAVPIALHGKEALAGVVGVQEMHLAHIADLFILLAIRLKGDASMEKHLQIGPHLVDARFAGLFEHFFQHGEEPRRHTAQVGHVLSDARFDQQRQFLGPVLHECHAAVGNAHQVGQRVHVLDEVGAQVPYPHSALQLQVVGEAAAQDERFARKNAARRV